MTTIRYCKQCKVYRKIDLDDFLKSGKKRICCGECHEVLMTKTDAYEIVYGGYF